MCLTSCSPLPAAPGAWSSVNGLDCTALPIFPKTAADGNDLEDSTSAGLILN